MSTRVVKGRQITKGMGRRTRAQTWYFRTYRTFAGKTATIGVARSGKKKGERVIYYSLGHRILPSGESVLIHGSWDDYIRFYAVPVQA